MRRKFFIDITKFIFFQNVNRNFFCLKYKHQAQFKYFLLNYVKRRGMEI